MKNKIWIVEMLRWGDRANHSYVLGVYSKKHKAQKEAKQCEVDRGGKYTADITESKII